MTDAGYEWPADRERTPPDEREHYPGDISLGRLAAFESIVDELERWGATAVDVQSASDHYANRPNVPHKSSDPDDPTVVAWFRRLEDRADQVYSIPCDRWSTQRENARAIALFARRQRLAERCGVTLGQSTMSTAALPPADEDDVVAAPAAGAADDEEPHEILELAPDASPDAINLMFRQKVKAAHPDAGGEAGSEDVRRLKWARDEMLARNGGE